MITGRPDFYMRKGVPVYKFFDPETKTCMQRMFSVLLQGERQIEKYREALAKRIYMDFHCAFLLIDTDRDDYISPAELRDFLANQGFYASDRELQGLFNRLDTEKTGRISYDHFRRGLMQNLSLYP
jgi:hypothetical protein